MNKGCVNVNANLLTGMCSVRDVDSSNDIFLSPLPDEGRRPRSSGA